MNFPWSFAFVFSFLLFFLGSSNQQEVGYHSIQQPFGLPYWTLGGDAQLTETFVRLAEDRQSKSGWFWNNMPTSLSDWEVTFQFRIHGVSKVGADGMAFWYIENPKQTGHILGNEEKFNGLGLLIDTYDNDNTGLHPYLSVVVNDGTKPFSHDHEGRGGYQKGGCQIRARNFLLPSTIRVRYQNQRLSVWYTPESKGNGQACVVDVPVYLPKGYYFGFSAATGHLADNHDLHSFSVVNLDPHMALPPAAEPSFGRVLNSIFVAHRDVANSLGEQQQLVMSKIEQLNSALQNLNGGLQRTVVSSPLSPAPVRVDTNLGRLNEKECGNILHTVTIVQKALEKVEREQVKRVAEIKADSRQVPTPREAASSSIIEWINLFLLFGLVVFFVINEITKMNDRSKKYF